MRIIVQNIPESYEIIIWMIEVLSYDKNNFVLIYTDLMLACGLIVKIKYGVASCR